MPHKLEGKWGWVKGSRKPNYELRLHNWLVTQPDSSPHPRHVFLYVSVGTYVVYLLKFSEQCLMLVFTLHLFFEQGLAILHQILG